MTIPKPLPPIPQLPEVLAAQQLRQSYLDQATAIRFRSGDYIAKARTVVDVWERTNAALANRLGPFGAIPLWMAGLVHESPLDAQSFAAEQQY